MGMQNYLLSIVQNTAYAFTWTKTKYASYMLMISIRVPESGKFLSFNVAFLQRDLYSENLAFIQIQWHFKK